jgi:hypothetical protein
MRERNVLIGAVVAGAIALAGVGGAQTRTLTDSECQGLQQRIDGHAQVSEGVRRLLGPPPAASGMWPTAVSPAASGRADAIRARLAQIPGAREQLEGQRVAAVMHFDVSRAMRVQGALEALDRERADLEGELAAQPAATPPSTPPAPTPPSRSEGVRVQCQDATATHATAIRIRQKELGAREGQAGAIPLLALKGPGADQIARELHDQFAAWPAAADQIGLLDQNGDGRIDGFVDVPAERVFRLYRQRTDGTLTVETFGAATTPSGYRETTRRLDEAVVRHAGYSIADLLSRRPAGPARIVGETTEFSRSFSKYLTGNFGDASRRDSAARTREFPNFRGEPVRVMDVIAPTAGGLSVRQLIVLPKPNGQELWEETTTRVRTSSSFEAEVETTMSRETRTGWRCRDRSAVDHRADPRQAGTVRRPTGEADHHG